METGEMLVKVALVQHAVGGPVSLDLKLHLFRQRPDFICFPEYWGARAAMSGQRDLARRAAKDRTAAARLSADLACVVVGGTTVEDHDGALRNVAPVYQDGRLLGDYAKRFPTAHERERGIHPGREAPVWDLGFARIGVAVCADCLQPEVFAGCARERVDILFVPNASPHRPAESAAEKFARDEAIFVAGAKQAGAYIVKVCGVGRLFGGRLQGRSLVAAPWGILNRVPPDEEDRAQVITANLSIDELREFRRRFRPELQLNR